MIHFLANSGSSIHLVILNAVRLESTQQSQISCVPFMFVEPHLGHFLIGGLVIEVSIGKLESF